MPPTPVVRFLPSQGLQIDAPHLPVLSLLASLNGIKNPLGSLASGDQSLVRNRHEV
jgi:hypothetical protein